MGGVWRQEDLDLSGYIALQLPTPPGNFFEHVIFFKWKLCYVGVVVHGTDFGDQSNLQALFFCRGSEHTIKSHNSLLTGGSIKHPPPPHP